MTPVFNPCDDELKHKQRNKNISKTLPPHIIQQKLKVFKIARRPIISSMSFLWHQSNTFNHLFDTNLEMFLFSKLPEYLLLGNTRTTVSLVSLSSLIKPRPCCCWYKTSTLSFLQLSLNVFTLSFHFTTSLGWKNYFVEHFLEYLDDPLVSSCASV